VREDTVIRIGSHGKEVWSEVKARKPGKGTVISPAQPSPRGVPVSASRAFATSLSGSDSPQSVPRSWVRQTAPTMGGSRNNTSPQTSPRASRDDATEEATVATLRAQLNAEVCFFLSFSCLPFMRYEELIFCRFSHDALLRRGFSYWNNKWRNCLLD
jgi:hypothetical protein